MRYEILKWWPTEPYSKWRAMRARHSTLQEAIVMRASLAHAQPGWRFSIRAVEEKRKEKKK